MKNNQFDWSNARPLNISQQLIATFVPSGIAFAGFHGLLPRMVKAGVPPLLGWSLVAGAGLFLLVVAAGFLLVRDACEMGLSLRTRLCLVPVSARQWVFYIGLVVLLVIGTLLVQPLLPVLWELIGFHVPEYYPFFLRGIDPTTAPPDVVSPGLPLRSAYWVLPLIAVVLALNIIAEDFYFRAWLLPKMSWMGSYAWIANGLLFAFYHTFQLWILPILLMASLSFAFVVWHGKSILPSLVLHFVLNFLFSILGILTLVIGL